MSCSLIPLRFDFDFQSLGFHDWCHILFEAEWEEGGSPQIVTEEARRVFVLVPGNQNTALSIELLVLSWLPLLSLAFGTWRPSTHLRHWCYVALVMPFCSLPFQLPPQSSGLSWTLTAGTALPRSLSSPQWLCPAVCVWPWPWLLPDAGVWVSENSLLLQIQNMSLRRESLKIPMFVTDCYISFMWSMPHLFFCFDLYKISLIKMTIQFLLCLLFNITVHTSQSNLLKEMRWCGFLTVASLTTGCVSDANVMTGFWQHLDSFVVHVCLWEAKLNVMPSTFQKRKITKTTLGIGIFPSINTYWL